MIDVEPAQHREHDLSVALNVLVAVWIFRTLSLFEDV